MTPNLVKGKASITDADNQTYGDREVIALCRCGGSTSKPFCDGAHSRNGFAAAERAVREADEG